MPQCTQSHPISATSRNPHQGVLLFWSAQASFSAFIDQKTRSSVSTVSHAKTVDASGWCLFHACTQFPSAPYALCIFAMDMSAAVPRPDSISSLLCYIVWMSPTIAPPLRSPIRVSNMVDSLTIFNSSRINASSTKGTSSNTDPQRGLNTIIIVWNLVAASMASVALRVNSKIRRGHVL